MEALEVRDVDLDCLQNCRNHYTTQFFNANKLIVRRGQAFGFYVHFQNREWDDDKDKIVFTVETGPKPCESLGTKCTFALGGSPDQSSWNACYKLHNERCLIISLCPPVNACIGSYALNMCLMSGDHTNSQNLGDFYVLFNPWCSADPVYLDSQAQREEYVLNEHGIIFQGLPKHITSHPWHFGQFQDSILEICLKILDTNTNFLRDPGMDCSCRNDPVYISKVVNNMVAYHYSSMIDTTLQHLEGVSHFTRSLLPPEIICCLPECSRDLPEAQDPSKWFLQPAWSPLKCLWKSSDKISCHKKKGILKFPPSNNHLQGLNPLMWNGSVPILRQWYHNKCKPVKYGHCGTFASVMCTVMRCLGIPSRVVTGFYCPLNAADTFIVQDVFDYTGKTLSGKENIWTHHCWNESWMARKDINQSGGDWQYLDPTPVETSKGSVCSGPVWVNSIRDGDVDSDSDGSHVFCLLNARSTAWVSQGRGKKTKLHCDSWPCGQCISTKGVGSDLREDVTNAYKHELGSAEEKKALYKACRKINSQYLNAPNSEIEKDISSHRNRSLRDTGLTMKFKPAHCPLYGQDIQMNWVLENLSDEIKDKKFNLCAQGMMYNGCPLDHFWKDNIHITLGPKEAKTILLNIPYDNYGPHLCEHNIVRVVAVSMPEPKGEVLMVKRDILIDSLPIEIKILENPSLNTLCTAEVTFSNPLKEDLKNCVLNLEGYGLIGEPTATELGTLAAHHMAQTCVEFTPYRYGRHRFMASISCNKFCNCKGYANIDIGKPPTTSGEGGAEVKEIPR